VILNCHAYRKDHKRLWKSYQKMKENYYMKESEAGELQKTQAEQQRMIHHLQTVLESKSKYPRLTKELQVEVDELQKTIAEQREKVYQLEDEVDELQKTLAEQREKIYQLQAELQSKSKYPQLTKDLQFEVDELQNEQAEQREKVKQLQAELDSNSVYPQPTEGLQVKVDELPKARGKQRQEKHKLQKALAKQRQKAEDKLHKALAGQRQEMENRFQCHLEMALAEQEEEKSTLREALAEQLKEKETLQSALVKELQDGDKKLRFQVHELAERILQPAPALLTKDVSKIKAESESKSELEERRTISKAVLGSEREMRASLTEKKRRHSWPAANTITPPNRASNVSSDTPVSNSTYNRRPTQQTVHEMPYDWGDPQLSEYYPEPDENQSQYATPPESPSDLGDSDLEYLEQLSLDQYPIPHHNHSQHAADLRPRSSPPPRIPDDLGDLGDLFGWVDWMCAELELVPPRN
jgi:hypothetical protein